MIRSLSTIEVLAILAACLVASIALFNGTVTSSGLQIAILFVTVQIIWIVARDVADFVVPDGAVIALTVAGAVVRLVIAQDTWLLELEQIVIDGALCGLAFLGVREAFFRLKGFDGMGFGDVKLAVASGVLVGLEAFAWSVFLASALGLAIVFATSRLKPDKKLDRLPFGALLAPSCWAMWLAQLWGAL